MAKLSLVQSGLWPKTMKYLEALCKATVEFLLCEPPLLQHPLCISKHMLHFRIASPLLDVPALVVQESLDDGTQGWNLQVWCQGFLGVIVCVEYLPVKYIDGTPWLTT